MRKYKIGDLFVSESGIKTSITKIYTGDSGCTFYEMSHTTTLYTIYELDNLVKLTPVSQEQKQKVPHIDRVYYRHWRYVDKDQTAKHTSTIYYNDGPIEYIYCFNKASYPLNTPVRYKRNDYNEWKPACNGGATECVLLLSNGEEIIGSSECSVKDNFVYEEGRKLARARAKEKYNEKYPN